MASIIPYIPGKYNPLYNPTNQGFFHCSLENGWLEDEFPFLILTIVSGELLVLREGRSSTFHKKKGQRFQHCKSWLHEIMNSLKLTARASENKPKRPKTKAIFKHPSAC